MLTQGRIKFAVLTIDVYSAMHLSRSVDLRAYEKVHSRAYEGISYGLIIPRKRYACLTRAQQYVQNLSERFSNQELRSMVFRALYSTPVSTVQRTQHRNSIVAKWL